MKKASIRAIFIVFVLANSFLFYQSYRYLGRLIRGSDGQLYYAYVRSLIIDRDLNFRNEFEELTPFPKKIGGIRTTKTGHIANKVTVGFALLAAPFFLLAHIITILGNLAGVWRIPADGYAFFYDLIVPFGNMIYAILGFYFGYKFLKEFFSEKYVLLSLITVWFGTNLVYYSTMSTMMPHALGFFCVNFLFYASIKAVKQPKWRWYISAGCASGLMLIVRPSNFVFIIYPFFLFGKIIIDKVRNKDDVSILWPKFLAAFIAFLSIISIQLLCWKIVYGEYIVYSYEGERINWASPQILKVLFSSNHGLFYWEPLVVFSFIGLIISIFRDKKISSMVFFITLSVLIYDSSIWHTWDFGHSFGARNFVDAGLIFAYGLIYFYKKFFKKFESSLIFSCIFIVWNFYLLLLYRFEYLPRQGEIPFSAMFPFIKL